LVATAAILLERWVVPRLWGSAEERAARSRVVELFEALGDETTAADLALARWYGGRLPTDPDLRVLLGAEFAGFCAQHRLRPMRIFEVRQARETGEEDRLGAAVVVVSGVANGEPFRLRVQRGRTISWAD
jgi:hypothetical protein